MKFMEQSEQIANFKCSITLKKLLKLDKLHPKSLFNENTLYMFYGIPIRAYFK